MSAYSCEEPDDYLSVESDHGIRAGEVSMALILDVFAVTTTVVTVTSIGVVTT